MGSENVQVSFFQHIKALLPPYLSLVDEIAELLNISNDSAYRRLRGEKPIDFDELQKLCGHLRYPLISSFTCRAIPSSSRVSLPDKALLIMNNT